MKIVVIGDIHGRDAWKRILTQEKDYNLVVFMGDYFDSFTISVNVQISNFLDIIEFRDSDPLHVKLLIGNHDISYYPGQQTCSGYQRFYSPQIREVLKSNFEKLQVAFQFGKWLFTHAGVSKTWMSSSKFESIDDINEGYPEKYANYLFNGVNRYGDDITQGPFWIRPKSLMKDGWWDGVQVVGHTPQPDIKIIGNFIFVDALEYDNKYFVIEDDRYLKKNVE